MYEELKARLRAWCETSSCFGLDSIGKDAAQSLEAIEQLERQLAERDAEIAKLIQAVADHVTVRSEQYAELQKYRDAPVVAYVNFADNGNIRIWTRVSDHAMHIAEERGFVLQRLIVKPGEQ